MKIKRKEKKISYRKNIKTSFNFSLNLLVLVSFLFSQLSLSDILLYKANNSKFLNTARADVSDPWYNARWPYRKEITINHTKIPNTDQSNFPVLVSLTDPNLKTIANGGKVNNLNGYDILFASQAGTKLDHEIEKYDAATGTIAMWVKIPTLSYAVDTNFYMYYGNANVTSSQENKTAVWNDGGVNNFKGVWHLKEDPSLEAPQMKDSTSNANNGTSVGPMTSADSVDGKIGKALNFGRVNDYVHKTDNSSLDFTTQFTISFWVNSAFSSYYSLVGKTSGGGATDHHYFLAANTKDLALTVGNSAGNYDSLTKAGFFTGYENAWVRVTATYNNGVMRLYRNGVSQTSKTSTITSLKTTSSRFEIGRFPNYSTDYLHGSMDELSVANTERSVDWIQTEFNNQSSPSTFFALGSEELAPEQMDYLVITGSSSQTAGIVQNITITAKTNFHNTYLPYNGGKTIIFSGANSIGLYVPTCSNVPFGTGTALTFTNGVAHCDLKLYKTETSDISAGDGTYTATGHTLNVAVSPDQINSFEINAPATAVSGNPFSLALTAKDHYGNVTTNVTSPTALSMNIGTITPATIANTGFQTNGVYTGNATISGVQEDANVTLTAQNGSINQTAGIQVTAASIPQEVSHSNSSTYQNLNTITDTGNITFDIGYDVMGSVEWHKDGVLVKTDSDATTSEITTAWTSSDYGKVKEIKAKSTNESGTSLETIWKVEVEQTGTATIEKITNGSNTQRIDGQDTLYVGGANGSWTNLPSLYLTAKQEDNLWMEYVKAKTYILKKPLRINGVILNIDSTTARDVYLMGKPVSNNNAIVKIRVKNNGTITIDRVNFYGWDITGSGSELVSGNLSPVIASDGVGESGSTGNNTMNITNSNFRHIMIHYDGDKSGGDIMDNNTFLEGFPYNTYMKSDTGSGSQGQTVSNNTFIDTENFNSDRNISNAGLVVKNNKFASKVNRSNVLLGYGSKLIGNEVFHSSWNLVEFPRESFSKFNNLHDSGKKHNGFNGPDESYSVNDYCHHFNAWSCWFMSYYAYTNPVTFPSHVYIINGYVKQGNTIDGLYGSGINTFGLYDSYFYNFTADYASSNTQYGSDHIVYRKATFLNSPQQAVRVADDDTSNFGYVRNLYFIDSEFSYTNNLDYQIVSEPRDNGNPIINSINTFRRNSDNTIRLPRGVVYGNATYNGEVRSYVYLDAFVQDQNGNPISGATITITPLTDPTYPAIKTVLPPPPPDLDEHPAENLPIPTVETFDSVQTGSDGHTLLPNYGWSANSEATTALLFSLQKSGSRNTSNYQYQITATFGANTISKTITPDASWYREDPTQPSKTVVLTFNKEAGKSALNVNSGTGSGLHTPAQVINITANPAPSGKVFDKWIGDTTGINNTSSENTSITIQSSDASITPYYKDITYHLTVVGGTGSGDYPAGKIVVADASPTNGTQVFYKWTGTGLSSIVSPTVYSSTLTMPAQNITVTANYRNPLINYNSHLTVADGTGTDFYNPTETTTITPNPPLPGKTFDKWEGDTTYIDDINSDTATVTMPDRYIILAATYKNTSITSHDLTLIGATGSGGAYEQGETITITASTPPIGKLFDQWTGDTTYVTNVNLDTTTVTMPNSNITLTATYEDAPTVSIPTFSPIAGTYTSAQTIALSSATSGASIYYTNNGTDPTISSTHYTTPFTVSSTATIKAIAVKTGYSNSAIATATYTINIPSSGGGSSSGGGGGSGSGGGSTPLTPVIVKTEIKSLVGNTLTLNLNVTNATQMMLSDTSNFLGATWQTYIANPTYTKQLTQSKLYLKFKSSSDTISSTIELPIPTTPIIPTPPTSDAPYPTGTLLKLSDSFKVYVIIGGNKKWISTPEVFEQLGYKWTEIKVITESQLNQFPDYEDNLIRAIGDYKVYLVVNGVKRHIPNPIIFLDYGFKWNEVKDVPQTTIDKYKPTYLIKQSGTNGIYYVNPQEIRKLIPSTEVFNSYNDKQEDIQIISKTEMDFYPLSNLIKLNGSNDIYLIEGNIKKHIPNIQVFNKYKLNWNLVMSVNQTEFNFYSDGGELK